ncbi:PAS domain S-box protein [Accumulibacter sp.]|uniref:PAS domain S-box protein n=1 Tax=Accumulibacter sp. TaxID=2053492 RepID=UPI0028C42933|nr:PAS domain S-box protein [Accumulibacter sp.]
MHKLLNRQIRRVLGVDGERATDVFDELRQLAAEHPLSPEAARLLADLDTLFGQVERAYEQNDRDLELRTRSLDLSSTELLETNERLRNELASRTRAIHSLRATAGGLLGGTDGDLPTLVDDDLESLSALMADLVRQREESRHDLQGALAALANQKFALDQHAIVNTADKDGIITYANDKFCAISGYTRGEVLGHNHRLLNSGVHPPAFFAELWATISAAKVWHGELCNRRKNGERYWVSGTIVPFCDERGRPAQYISIHTDITERKRVEARLADSEQRFRRVVESLKEVVFRTDADGCWTYLNPAWSEITGYAVHESLGRPSLASVPAEDRDYAVGRFAALATRQIEFTREEARYRTRYGKERWLELFARAEFDDDGRFTGCAGTLNDVTERRLALEQLQEQLHLVQELFEVMPLPIYLTDTAGRYVHLNRAFGEFFAINRRQWVGQAMAELLPADLATLHADRDREILAAVGQQVYEAQAELHGGERRDTIYHKVTLTKADGSITGLLGAIVDITERKAHEAAVSGAESRLRQITNSVPAVVFQCAIGPERIRYTFLSDRLSEIRGLAREALFADSDLATRQVIGADVQRVEHGVRGAAARREAWQGEYRIRLPNGALRWIRGEIKPAPEPPAADGATIFTGIWQDVTALKKADARLREVTDNIPVAVYQYERWRGGKHAFHFFSRALDEICGLSAEQAMASADALFQLVHPEDRQLVEMPVAAKQSRWSLDFRLVHRRSGETVWIHGEAQGTDMANGSTLWNGYLADTSAAKLASEELRRAKEGAEAANRAKSEFLANMSHEIRTPMNGVIGMTHLVLDSQLSDEQRSCLQIVKDSSDALLTIINDILDFSKIEAGKLFAERISFKLWRVVGETLKTQALRAHDKGLELICDIAPEVPLRVIGDPGRLRQVLLNLIGNAIKFTPQGEVLLRLELACADGEKTGEVGLHFTIVDSGIGIPDDKLATIFDPFAQADGSITRRYGGTGLGLSISARLAELLGGRLWVESQLGRGSTFHFTMRCEADPQAPQQALPPPQLAGKRLLLVIGHATTRRGIARTLESAGAAVAAAESGEAALATLTAASSSIDLALLDADLPGTDAYGLATRVRAAPGRETIPLLIISARPHRGDAERCRQLGSAEFLAKPFAGDELLQALNRLLDSRPHPGAAVVSRPLVEERTPSCAVLLVEDNPVNQQVAKGILEHLGHQVTLAEDGLAAVERLGAGKFDVVLMDMMMPQMDGVEASRRIRADELTTGRRRLPIIAMTANAMKGDREECLAAGMDDYLTKPVHSEELQQLLLKYGAVTAAARRSSAPPVEAGTQRRSQPMPGGFDYGAALASADQETVELIAAQFLEHSPHDLNTIGRGIANGDLRSVASAAAALKGTLAIFGARPAVHLAHRIEQRSAFSDPPELYELLGDLGEQIECLCVALRPLAEASSGG